MLSLIRDAISNDTVDFVPRDKNRRTMQKLNLTLRDVYDVMFTLTEDNYYRGPIEDTNMQGEYLWIFKAFVFNYLLYIKIGFRNKHNKQMLVIISFHEDE